MGQASVDNFKSHRGGGLPGAFDRNLSRWCLISKYVLSRPEQGCVGSLVPEKLVLSASGVNAFEAAIQIPPLSIVWLPTGWLCPSLIHLVPFLLARESFTFNRPFSALFERRPRPGAFQWKPAQLGGPIKLQLSKRVGRVRAAAGDGRRESCRPLPSPVLCAIGRQLTDAGEGPCVPGVAQL